MCLQIQPSWSPTHKWSVIWFFVFNQHKTLLFCFFPDYYCHPFCQMLKLKRYSSVNKFLLTFGNLVRWGHCLHLNTAWCFFGMEICGELSTSGSWNKTAWDGAAVIRTSSEGSDRQAADSTLMPLTGTALSGTLLEAVSSISAILWGVERGVSVAWWKLLPMEKNVSYNVNKPMSRTMPTQHKPNFLLLLCIIHSPRSRSSLVLLMTSWTFCCSFLLSLSFM